ncbi:MAG: beta-lactamase family protein [Clostridia bacterium]|nr:beta-lactamase family protein [Clostridia bacterium]
MRRAFFRLLCTLILALSAGNAFSEALSMDEQVDAQFRKARAVGGAFVVAQNGSIVYERYFGVQQKSTNVPVTEKTYFKCASVTKFVTGIGLLKMMDDGILDPDTDISVYLGYKAGNPRYENQPITLRHLMSHTSGINEEGSYSKKSSILSDMIAYDKKAKSNFRDVAPGAQYRYSNFGAGITGAIVESVTGEDVSTFMRHYLFAPLGIDAAYTATQIAEPDYIVATYHQDGDLYQAPSYMLRQEYEAVADPDHHYRTTVGSLLIRPRDLTRLGIAACGDGSVDGIQVLSAEALDRMREPQSPETTGITEKSPYSFFCIRQDTVLTERTVYGHQGTSEGIVCNLYFEPESQLVICVMTNGCRTARDDGVMTLTRRLASIAEEAFLK